MLLKLKLSRAHSQPQASSLGMSKDQHKRKIPEMSKKKKKRERERINALWSGEVPDICFGIWICCTCFICKGKICQAVWMHSNSLLDNSLNLFPIDTSCSSDLIFFCFLKKPVIFNNYNGVTSLAGIHILEQHYINLHISAARHQCNTTYANIASQISIRSKLYRPPLRTWAVSVGRNGKRPQAAVF